MTITDFFKDCSTEQETKTRYRHLSKIFHPDLGGTKALFQELNDCYHAKLKSLHGSYNSKEDQKEGKRQYQYCTDLTIPRKIRKRVRDSINTIKKSRKI